MAAAKTIPGAKGDIAVLLTDDAAIRELNRQWRKFDKPTNVLSFPAPPRPRAQKGREQAAASEAPDLLGDIVIAHETTAREAAAEGKPLSHHLAHLAVHGFLHLLGYDHESDAAAQDMERLETGILARLDVPDPYLMRDGA
jgi:probable rRNA maturation factor